MTDNIHYVFSTKALKYLKNLPGVEQNEIQLLIRKRVYGFLYHNDRRYLKQDHYFSKMGLFDSTIYYIRLDHRKRAIISVDDDPIFEEVRINIYAICNRDSLEREIKGVMESLYQQMINPTSSKKEETE